MRIAALLMLQATTATPPDIRFDLRRLAPSERCGEGGGDIRVCGKRDPDRYRLRALPEGGDAPMLPKAEIGLGGGMKAAAEADQVQIGPGAVSQRLMVRLKMPF